MSGRLNNVILLVLAGALLFGASRVQNSLNRDRERLGLTRVQPLDNAPPVLAFTTVALGGFRGLIANALWIRANDLQTEDKFFEMAQLADWITKLEPHVPEVWIFQEWNMAWNISVKFKDYSDRWRWVQRGIRLLRDEGLRYNPNSILMYRELAWIFQNKIGAVTDDANMYYKQQWANEMAEVFGNKKPDLDELIHPKTEDEKKRAALLRDKFKLDPVFMKKVDEEYGPLEWRLPEAHAIYWAALGLEKAKENPTKVKKSDLIMLHRVIYQSLLLALYRGKLEANPYEKVFELGPNLDILPKLNAAYEQAIQEDPDDRDNIENAQRNALRDAVYFLYVNNRVAEAQKWFKYLGEKYPNKPILDSDPTSLPSHLTLDQYAIACVQGDVNETSPDRIRSAILGLLLSSYRSLVLNEDDRAAAYKGLANKIWSAYESKIPEDRKAAMNIGSMAALQKEVLDRVLNTTNGFIPEMRAVLRTKLRLPPETAPSSSTTNSASPTAPAQ